MENSIDFVKTKSKPEPNKEPGPESGFFDSKNRKTSPEPGDLVEGPFGRRIFVQYDKPTKHKHFALPDGHLAFCINGTSGSGKSTVICSLLPFISNLSQVLIFSCISEEVNKAYQAIHAWCDKSDIEYGIVDNPRDAKLMMAEFQEKKKPESFGICIMDDFNQQKSGKNDAFNSEGAVIAAMQRNYGYHCVFVCQATQGVPTSIRNNTNIKIVFRMNEEHAIRGARLDFLNSGVIKSREEFDGLFAIIQKIDHSYLMLDRARGKLFIYIPPGNPDGSQDIQPVEFVGAPSDSQSSSNGRDEMNDKIQSALNEPIFTSLLKEMMNKNGPLGKLKLKKVKADIENYLLYFSHRFGIPIEMLRDAVQEKIKTL